MKQTVIAIVVIVLIVFGGAWPANADDTPLITLDEPLNDPVNQGGQSPYTLLAPTAVRNLSIRATPVESLWYYHPGHMRPEISFDPPSTTGGGGIKTYHLYRDDVYLGTIPKARAGIGYTGGYNQLSELLPGVEYTISIVPEDNDGTFGPSASVSWTQAAPSTNPHTGAMPYCVYILDFPETLVEEPPLTPAQARSVTYNDVSGSPVYPSLSDYIREISYGLVTGNGFTEGSIQDNAAVKNTRAFYSPLKWVDYHRGEPSTILLDSEANTSISGTYNRTTDCNDDGTANDPCRAGCIDFVPFIYYRGNRGHWVSGHGHHVVGAKDFGAIFHEYLHQITYLEGPVINCYGGTAATGPLSWTPFTPDTECFIPTSLYSAVYSAKGGGSGHPDAWTKYLAGWLTDDNIATVSTTGSANYVIDQFELPSAGDKMLKIPLVKDGAVYKDAFLFAEFRTLTGYDSVPCHGCLGGQMDKNHDCLGACNTGVTLYDGLVLWAWMAYRPEWAVSPYIGPESVYRVYQIQGVNSTSLPVMQEGEQYFDRAQGMCIKLASIAGTGASKQATVTVTRGVSSCP